MAVELHRPGIARMLHALEADGPPNVRIIETDVTRLLDVLTGPEAPADRPSIDCIRVLFPDPWPKARHRSRRLVDGTFVSTAADLLAPGGTLHLATYWDGYARQMALALLAEPRFEIDADPDALGQLAAERDARPDVDASTADDDLHLHEGPLPWSWPRPERPVTTYERRGTEAGRRVTDLVARLRGG
jgi:tRNA (guanine-N7-)-methyltransferase